MSGMFRVFTIISFIDVNGIHRNKKTTLTSCPVVDEKEARNMAMEWRDRNGTKDTYFVFEPFTKEI